MLTSRIVPSVVSHDVSGFPSRVGAFLLLLVIAVHLASSLDETKIYRDGVCGAVQLTLDTRIAGGNAAEDGDWPWHGALFFGKDYKCGCSLISEWFVLTAGHCLFNPDTGYRFDIKRLRVVLGLLDLNQHQSHSREFQVKEINVYPKFTTESHKHDLAILLLNEAVEFSEKIRPIKIIDSKPTFIEKVAGNYGTVVGWGFTEEAKVSNQLRTAQMLIARYADCVESNPDLFGQLIHNGMYCAGAENGTNVCNGDSGGGMYIFQHNSWHLQGLVSFAALRDGTNLCDLYSYAAFTNVPHYLDWIESQLQDHQRKMQEQLNRELKEVPDEGTTTTTTTTTMETPTSTAAVELHPLLDAQSVRLAPAECLQQNAEIIVVGFNSSISLACKHGSDGEITEKQDSIRWFRENKYFYEIDLSSEIGLSKSGVHDILTLRHVDTSHSGRYFCRAKLPSANVTDRRIVSVVGVVPRFEPVDGSPAYMKYELLLNQQYFSLQVTFRSDREDGVLFYRTDEWDHQIMKVVLVNGMMELDLLTERKTVRKIGCKKHRISLGEWHTVKLNCHLGRCYATLDGEMMAQFSENLFLTSGGKDFIYLGGIPNRNESGFTGCISQMFLNDYPIHLRQEVIKSERISDCNHCTVNTCLNGGVCVETSDRNAFRCLCPDGFTGRHCSNVGERCRATSCVEAICHNFENGFRCACSSTRTGKRCEAINDLNGKAISFRSFGFAKYKINLTKHFQIQFQFLPRNTTTGALIELQNDIRGTGNFMALTLNNGVLELRYTIDLDVTVFTIRSSVSLNLNSWHSVKTGYQSSSIYLQVDDEPSQSKSIFNGFFNLMYDHYVNLGGVDDCVAWGQCPERTSDYDGCIKELFVSGHAVDLTRSFIDARNVENCRINES